MMTRQAFNGPAREALTTRTGLAANRRGRSAIIISTFQNPARSQSSKSTIDWIERLSGLVA